MLAEKHNATPNIRGTLDQLNSEWAGLSDKARDKGIKLRQAAQQVRSRDVNS